MNDNRTPDAPEQGQDTATGTDPDAKYAIPGFEDQSFRQVVNQDQELVQDLFDETDGDVEDAESKSRHESARSRTIDRQQDRK